MESPVSERSIITTMKIPDSVRGGMAISTDSVFEHGLVDAFLRRSITGYKVSVGHFCMREALPRERGKRVADMMHVLSDSSSV